MTTSLPQLPTTRASRFGLLVAFWSLFTVLILGHAYISMEYIANRDYRLAYAVSAGLQGLIWIGVTPLVIWTVRRLPLAGRRWARNALLHALVAALGVAGVALLVMIAVAPLELPPEVPDTFYSDFWRVYTRVILLFMLLWFGVAAAATAAEATREALAERKRAAETEAALREKEVHDARLRERAAQLEGQLAAAQLEALRMQLNPHFLFNTLHAVSTLMARDVDGARRMISDLSDLLRVVLDGSDSPETPLNEELDMLGHYLDIERTRFADRLTVDIDVDRDTRGALVPTLLLQPLVENAVKHGIAPRGEGGRISVAAHRSNGHLVVHVCDDGPGVGPGGPSREGVGLRNTRDRLAKLYGENAALTLRDRPEGGLDAQVRLPFRTA
ncbi:MAG: histidine kinase [Bacteroidota bacterium]